MEQHDDFTNTGYWRGRIDARLEGIETHMTNIMLQVEHMHRCLEKRTRLLYLYAGGLAVTIMLLQIFGPFIAKALLK